MNGNLSRYSDSRNIHLVPKILKIISIDILRFLSMSLERMKP